MAISITACIFCWLLLVWHTRLNKMSLGFPIAYLFCMLLQHLPGGFAHVVADALLFDSASTQTGLKFTAIGTASFVAGVVFVQRIGRVSPHAIDWKHQATIRRVHSFALFCLCGGWLVVYALGFLTRIPSFGAAVQQAGAIWVLGVALGLRMAVEQRKATAVLLWSSALSIYPVLTLLLAGFLSFGSTSVFVVFSACLATFKSNTKAYGAAALFSIVCVLTFLSYFQNRDDIRDAVWGGAELSSRMERSAKIVTGIRWFDTTDLGQLVALNERLNQGQFAGMAAEKLQGGQVEFLRGRSVWEGLLALIPRVLWEGKPIFAGSSDFIRYFTDFYVNEDTTYGVGQVMEFYINFGMPGLVVGFLALGLVLGWMDRNAAVTLHYGELGQCAFWFVCGLAISAPLASIAEITGNFAAASVAGLGWRYLWQRFDGRAGAKRNLSLVSSTVVEGNRPS